ncbi:hypothetical protein EVAR_57806_1 [Eumeta japonica]|uniref:Uncharacterized protein n=1 Tax=Eumeta variegata TaxID=151549 RepID=A0A4C1ZAK3_EUMVA|nr:hypothetical protein EVAR_57806_1 [Eumeta japonica]
MMATIVDAIAGERDLGCDVDDVTSEGTDKVLPRQALEHRMSSRNRIPSTDQEKYRDEPICWRASSTMLSNFAMNPKFAYKVTSCITISEYSGGYMTLTAALGCD